LFSFKKTVPHRTLTEEVVVCDEGGVKENCHDENGIVPIVVLGQVVPCPINLSDRHYGLPQS
jgi:hypothetical protein